MDSIRFTGPGRIAQMRATELGPDNEPGIVVRERYDLPDRDTRIYVMGDDNVVVTKKGRSGYTFVYPTGESMPNYVEHPIHTAIDLFDENVDRDDVISVKHEHDIPHGVRSKIPQSEMDEIVEDIHERSGMAAVAGLSDQEKQEKHKRWLGYMMKMKKQREEAAEHAEDQRINDVTGYLMNAYGEKAVSIWPGGEVRVNGERYDKGIHGPYEEEVQEVRCKQCGMKFTGKKCPRCKTVSAQKEHRSKFSIDEAKKIGEKLGINWDTNPFTVEDFCDGLNVELEHGTKAGKNNITDDDDIETAKIALAHLDETPEYYDRLPYVEDGDSMAIKAAYNDGRKSMPSSVRVYDTEEQDMANAMSGGATIVDSWS